MCCQMRIHETNERFIQLHTNTNTAFVTLDFVFFCSRKNKKEDHFKQNVHIQREFVFPETSA